MQDKSGPLVERKAGFGDVDPERQAEGDRGLRDEGTLRLWKAMPASLNQLDTRIP